MLRVSGGLRGRKKLNCKKNVKTPRQRNVEISTTQNFTFLRGVKSSCEAGVKQVQSGVRQTQIHERGPIWGSWWELPNFSIRTTAPSAPLCQVRHCNRCTTAPSMPQRQTRHGARRSTLLPTAVRTLPRQAGRGGNVIAAAEASAGTAFFLSTKITENTWKSGLRCDKIQIWI